jgi:hypothetical protein
MISVDTRGVRLRALDAKLLELSANGGDSAASVDDDGASLCDLAIAIARSMSEWNEILPATRLKRSSKFDPVVAGALAIESVFDTLLDGPSLGVLLAAFDLAATPR